MKLLLKSVVFFALAVWLAESAPTSLDSSSNNARERRSKTDLLQDLLSSMELQQQLQQQGEETPADTGNDDKEEDDEDAAIMSIAEAEIVRGFLDAMMEAKDAQIMTAFNDDDRTAEDRRRFIQRARSIMKLNHPTFLRQFIHRVPSLNVPTARPSFVRSRFV